MHGISGKGRRSFLVLDLWIQTIQKRQKGEVKLEADDQASLLQCLLQQNCQICTKGTRVRARSPHSGPTIYPQAAQAAQTATANKLPCPNCPRKSPYSVYMLAFELDM